jgi:hypothetical protein
MFTITVAGRPPPAALSERMTMYAKKTLLQRQSELQALMATAQGRDELETLANRYQAAGGKTRPAYTSIITYIIVHERGQGLIEG